MSETYVALDPPIACGVSGTSYIDVNASALVAGLPTNATGVSVVAINGDSGAGHNLYWRKNGSSDNRIDGITSSGRINACVGLDANFLFEVYRDSAYITFYITGYFINVAFNTNAINKSTETTGSWVDVDSGQATAIGLIFDYVSPSFYNFGLRCNGSTDNRINTVYDNNGGTFIIGASSGVCEQYISNTALDLYLVGYITSGFVFNTNATDISLASTAEYLDITALSALASANIIELVSATSGYSYTLRKNGSSSTTLYYKLYKHAICIVGADTSGISEGKISNTGLDFYGVGYVLPVGSLINNGLWGGFKNLTGGFSL